MVGLTGVTAIETRVAGVTVKVTGGDTIAPKVAVMIVGPVVPIVFAWARPSVVAVLPMVAIAGVPEFQTTVVVIFAVVPRR